MTSIKTYNDSTPIKESEKSAVVSFLYQHLEEYGDPSSEIGMAIDYASNFKNSPGGLILVSRLNEEIVGAVVINRTGMSKYIPENILVYIATHKEHRGKGIGRELMTAAIAQTSGDIALHVEPDNPAKQLYERLGFTNKYLEMRLKKTK